MKNELYSRGITHVRFESQRRARLSKQLAGICDNIMEGLQQTDDE